MAEALPARDEIETKYKWNAESVFPTVAAWDAEATAVTTAIDALKVAGVDMTTPAPVEAAFEVLAGYVDRLEKLVG